MSNQENPETVNSEVAALRAEVDRLSALVSSGQSNSTSADVNTTTAPPVRTPGQGATVIGANADPRGGTVLGYSDGTIRLVNVPPDGQNQPAQPWGNAPEGEYVSFFVDDNGNRYNFVSSDGSNVVSIDNPVQARP